MKKQLHLTITENDTIITITNGWRKPKEIPLNINDTLKFNNHMRQTYTFKIERIEK